MVIRPKLSKEILMESNIQYRVPSLEEFVQGFEYEAHVIGYMITGTLRPYTRVRILSQIPSKVKDEGRYRQIMWWEKGTYIGNEEDFLKIREMLEGGRIRVKVETTSPQAPKSF